MDEAVIQVAKLAYSDGYKQALADVKEAELNKQTRYDVVLWLEKCKPERLTANRVMLCTRNQFILENDRDLQVSEYNVILGCGNRGGIIRN